MLLFSLNIFLYELNSALFELESFIEIQFFKLPCESCHSYFKNHSALKTLKNLTNSYLEEINSELMQVRFNNDIVSVVTLK